MSETKEPKAIKWVLVGLTIFVGIMVLLIGAGAFTLSYQALYDTAIQNGVGEKWAWIWPLLIDIPLAVFTIGLLVAQVMRGNGLMWFGLIALYTLATIGFNLSHAEGNTWMGWIVAVVAPVGLLLTTEALRHLAKEAIERAATIASVKELVQMLTDKKNEFDKMVQDHQADFDTKCQELDAQFDTYKNELDTKRQGLDETILQKQQELDTLSNQIGVKRQELEQVKFDLKTVKNASILQAQEAKAAQDAANSQEKLTMLVDILDTTPGTSLTSVAEQLDVSRQTLYNYLAILNEQGVVQKVGKSWEVVKADVNGNGSH